jgi:hypothetical protein
MIFVQTFLSFGFYLMFSFPNLQLQHHSYIFQQHPLVYLTDEGFWVQALKAWSSKKQ